MKNFFSIFSAEALKQNLLRVAYRFPIPVILIFVLATLFFIIVHSNLSQVVEYDITRGILSVIVTFFLSLGVYISFENMNFSKLEKNISQVFVLVFGVLFFREFNVNFPNFDTDNIIFFILTLVGIISYLFISPYVKVLFNEKNKQDVYYSYFYKISFILFATTVLGGILAFLGSLAIGVTFTLFDISNINNDKVFSDWAIISLSIIAPLFALVVLPKQESFDKYDFVENPFFSFLVKYIAITFIYLYFFILYAYSVKVLSNFSIWPKGEVSWMVIGFSTFGYLIYMFSYIFEDTNKFIKVYRKVFPFVVIPQLFMLFYAIYLRIAQYDITMNRYFVVVFGIWLSVISIYFIISKSKKLSFIPLILTIFTIIISIGPWGVYALPLARQTSRLENNLKTAGILKNGEIIPLKNYEDINSNLSTEIYSEISYVCDFNQCNNLKKLFPKQYEEVLKKHDEDQIKNKIEKTSYNNLNSGEIVAGITEKIKVKGYYDNLDDSKMETLPIYLNSKSTIFPLDVNGYKTIISIGNNSGYYPKLNGVSTNLDVIINGNKIDIIDLKPIYKKIFESYKKVKRFDLDKLDLTFEIKNYKIIFQNITIPTPDYKGIVKDEYFDVNGYILVK